MIYICIYYLLVLLYRCSPLPSNDVFCRTTFKFSHYSLAITSRINTFMSQISMLSSNVNITLDCISLFGFYQCLGSFSPCNAATMKLYTFCDDTCSIINNLIQKCLRFTSIDPVLDQYFSYFNCSNPLTYSSSLSLDYYEPPNDEICSALRDYLGEFYYVIQDIVPQLPQLSVS